MDLGGAGAVGRAEADRRAADDEDRAGERKLLRAAERLVDRRGIVAVAVEDAPAVGLEARGRVVAEGVRDGALDRDAVAVVERDEARDAERAGEGRRLVRDAFLQVAVAAEHPDPVREQLRAGGVEARGGHGLRERHADGVGEALAERTGGNLDAGGAAALGVAGRLRAELAEAAQVVEREAEAELVQQRVEERRAVAAGEDEAVAIGPGGHRAGDAQVVEGERGRHVGHAHGHAGVAGIGLLDLVDREAAQDVGGLLDFFGGKRFHVVRGIGLFDGAEDSRNARDPQARLRRRGGLW